jgi:hypothetical protein
VVASNGTALAQHGTALALEVVDWRDPATPPPSSLVHCEFDSTKEKFDLHSATAAAASR